MVIFTVVGAGPLGIAAWLLFEGTQLQIGANERTLEILNKLAAATFQDVAKSMDKSRDKILESIDEQFALLKEKVTQTAHDLIEDERLAQTKILEDINKTESENKTESARQEKISSELHKRAALVYKALYNREPSNENLKALAAAVVDNRKATA